MVVETGKPDEFYARLTELVAAGASGAVEEVTSPDDNLQAVFKYLVKSMSDGDSATQTARHCSTSAMRVFDLSLGEMLWSRRTIFMALVVGLPVLLSLVVRVLHDARRADLRVNNTTVTGPSIFGLMIWVFFVRFSVPVLGVFYGTALIADEVEDKTITYLFTRPIPRGAVLLGKYLAYLACTVFVVLPSVVLVWLLDRADGRQPRRELSRPR